MFERGTALFVQINHKLQSVIDTVKDFDNFVLKVSWDKLQLYEIFNFWSLAEIYMHNKARTFVLWKFLP